MKSTQILKAAGSIACVVFALNVNAQAATTSTGASTSIGTKVDDTAITTKVKAEFVKDPMVKALQISVETFKGTVQLSGFVDTHEQKSRAGEVARGVNGVRDVKNNITVK